MKLQEILNQGYVIRAWSFVTLRSGRYIAVKLIKKTSRGEKSYVAYSPQVDTILADVEFITPVREI